jgi:hypothetical protein
MSPLTHVGDGRLVTSGLLGGVGSGELECIDVLGVLLLVIQLGPEESRDVLIALKTLLGENPPWTLSNC